MFGGKDQNDQIAPVEIMKEDQDWVIIEISGQGALPFVGMKSISLQDKFYIIGGLDWPREIFRKLNFSHRWSL